MIWKNIEVYGAVDFIQQEDGSVGPLRLPAELLAPLDNSLKGTARYSTGSELRFVINSGEAKITLRTEKPGLTMQAILYYGSIQSGWKTLEQVIYNTPTTLTLKTPDNIDELKKISQATGAPFSPEVIRILLPNDAFWLIGAEGDIRPPKAEEVPSVRGLFYGSSITHGSLCIAPNLTFATKIGRDLGFDALNYGFAGSCRIEPEVADYLAGRNDYDFAVAELGINVLNIDEEDYRRRVAYFIRKMRAAHPDRPLFLIDLFYFSDDFNGKDKPDRFRAILKEEAQRENDPLIIYTDGREILSGIEYISADSVHPNIDGCIKIAERLGSIIKDVLVSRSVL